MVAPLGNERGKVKGKAKKNSNKKPAVPVPRTVNAKKFFSKLVLEDLATETLIETPAVRISLIEVENIWRTIGGEEVWVKK